MTFGVESEDSRHAYRDAERLELQKTDRLDADVVVFGPDGELDRFEAMAVDAVSIPIGEDIVDLDVSWLAIGCRNRGCNQSFKSYDKLMHHLIRSPSHDYSTKITETCKECGDTFEYWDRESEEKPRGVFCNLECESNYRRDNLQEFECGWCGETFQDHPYRDRKYCSMQCSGPANLPNVAD